jgi:hypothetical protein
VLKRIKKQFVGSVAGASLSFSAWGVPGDTGPTGSEASDTPAIPAEAKPTPIGTAKMATDGTIVLTLEAPNPDGTKNYGVMLFPVGHLRYTEVLEHVGGLKPGETKPVAPWPQKP